MIGSLGSPALDASYDRWKTTPPEELETHFKCERCGFEFYPGDKFYDCEGYNFCRECAIEWIDEQAQTATEDMCYEE